MEMEKDLIEENKESKENNLIELDTDLNDIINKKSNQLVSEIVKAESKDDLETLYAEFSVNNTKKNALRVSELNNLLDLVNKQATKRFTEAPDMMSNKEILDYMNAVQNQIDRSQKIVEGINEINTLQVNNNTLNINVDNKEISSLNRESRENITSFIEQILNQSKESIDEEEVIDIEDNN